MNLYDEFGRIKKYKSVMHIIKDFYKTRMLRYFKRKMYLIEKINQELQILNYKILFIKFYNDGIIKVRDQTEKQII